MAQCQVQGILIPQPEGFQVCAFGEDVTQLLMLVLQAALLSGHHGVAVEDPGPARHVRGVLHAFRIGELRAAVCQQDMDMPAEDAGAEDTLQEVHPLLHGQRGLFPVEYAEKDAGVQELEGLDEGACGLIIVDGVHLGDGHARVFIQVAPVILVSAPQEEAVVRPLFKGAALLLAGPAGGLPAQVKGTDAGNLVEDPIFDIIIKGLLGNAELRVDLQDPVGGEPLFQEWGNGQGHVPRLGGGEVNPQPGIDQGFPVTVLCVLWGVGELVEPAVVPLGAAVAGSRGAVTPGTMERDEAGAARGAFPAVGAFFVSGTFQRETAFVGKVPMEFDLLSDGGLVLADGLGDGGF